MGSLRDDGPARREAADDFDQTVLAHPRLDAQALDAILVDELPQIGALSVRRDRGFRDGDRALDPAERELNVRELPRPQSALGVLDPRLHPAAAAALLDRRRDEVDLAGKVLVGSRADARADGHARTDEGELILRGSEDQLEALDRVDPREWGGGGDAGSDVYEPPPDLAGEGRADRRSLELEPREVELSLRCVEVGLQL